MGEPTRRIVVGVNGRVHELSPSRLPHVARREDPARWWRAFSAWSILTLPLGVLVGLGLGSPTAIGGFLLFLATAVVVGDERYELGTALGASGVVWTASGISVYLGVDPSLLASLVGFEVVGALGLIAAGLGLLRAGARGLASERPSPGAG